MTTTPTLARRLWEAVEPIHAVVYYAPEPAAAARELGLAGWWMGYFAGRLAPVGTVDGPLARSLCFAMAPRRVDRALPDAWARTAPRKVLDSRVDATRAALERCLPAVRHADLRRLVLLLERAVEGCGHEGRPLAAAWAAVPRPGTLLGRLWWAATVLREHRGDGHVMAVVHAGLTGLEAGVTHAATGDVSGALLRTSRGWTDDEWAWACRRLTARGLLTRAGRLTRSGGALRRSVEDATDHLAAAPVTLLGSSGVEDVIAVAAPLSRHLIDTGVVPVPNPIGVPRP